MTAPRHLCLVSNQPVPSLTPLLDPQLKVEQVTLVAAPERKLHAQWLLNALARHRIIADIEMLGDGYDLPGLRRDFARLAQRFPQGVIANITGGSKPMTIAAWETFDRAVDRLYYVDIHHDRVDWLRPAGLASLQVADRIHMETYFAALGQAFRKGSQPHRAALTELGYARLSQQARHLATRVGPTRTDKVTGGYWLEELVFEELRRLALQDRKIQDVARQFVLTNGAGHDERLENEIDVAVLRDNTLYLAECKTGAAGVGPAAMKALFKLAQLRETLGGLRGRGIFVSSEIVSTVVHARGRQLGIEVIDRPRLCDLPAHLKQALVGP